MQVTLHISTGIKDAELFHMYLLCSCNPHVSGGSFSLKFPQVSRLVSVRALFTFINLILFTPDHIYLIYQNKL